MPTHVKQGPSELDGSLEVVHTNSLHPILTLTQSREALSAMTLPDVHPLHLQRNSL